METAWWMGQSWNDREIQKEWLPPETNVILFVNYNLKVKKIDKKKE